MNPKRLLFLLFGIFVLNVCKAQSFVPAKDARILQTKMSDASKKINTIQCNFTQEKSMSMLAEKNVAKGKFYFKREGKVRLEYLQPVKNLIVMNGGKMMVADGKKSSQMDVHRSRVFQQLNNIIVGSINGSLFSSKEFSVQLFETTNQVKAELIPDSKTLKKFISTIVIVLDKKDFTAIRIEMNETSGDNTILTFSNKELNSNLDETLFAVK